MKVVVLTGSPHPNGTTATLADEFCAGVQEAKKHEIIRFDTAQREINPCIGCNYCHANDGRCVYPDDGMREIAPALIEADAVVLVTPLYYFGITAQLKATIDRFYAVNDKLRASPKKLYLLAACGDADEWAMDTLLTHVDSLCRYLNWEKKGSVLAYSCFTKEEVEKTQFPKLARELGASIS